MPPPDTDRTAREIQELEDRDILNALERSGTFVNGTSTFAVGPQRLDLAAIREELDRMPLRPERLLLSEQDYGDIFVEDGILPGDQIQVHGLPGSFTVQERVGMAVINPRGPERLAARRVQMPMFEIQSSPSINIGEIRARRFSLLEHRGDPAVKRILDAVIRAKSAPEPKSFKRTPGSPRSVWEALVDLDLIDVSSA